MTDDTVCRKCAGAMKASKAIKQTFVAGTPDFEGDDHASTFSAGGPGDLVDCLKCEDCGWSVTAGGQAVTDAPPVATARLRGRILRCRALADRLKVEGRLHDAQMIVDVCHSAARSSSLNSELAASYRATLADARQTRVWIDAILDAAELTDGDEAHRILPEIWPVISAAWQERKKGKQG